LNQISSARGIQKRFKPKPSRSNIKAELEIELLHQKIDQLRETEVLALTQAVERLTALLIPSLIDQNLCAHRRRPMDMMVHGCATSLFQE
jgi:uncharacterized membrane protein